MIDQLKNEKFIIIGEPKVHRSLHDLVSYHKKTKLSNWGHLLTVPCGQVSGECDYQELVREDAYFLLQPPEVPERNYSVNSTTLQLRPSAQTPARPQASEDRRSRPLPKLPEEAYHQLLTDSEYKGHTYNPLNSPKQQGGKSRLKNGK
ncbi:myosin-iiib [Plakobranchus ocellatus]|uniref:Myosin-iiib n=1 Tax=Plakobranchus ocellatus TaxID=259542 RepID=A0AAV4B781_9GAST|nr:myosin-iiib [Plakobranchus ocellatus]